MWKKICAVAIPVIIALGILAGMLISVREDISTAISSVIPTWPLLAAAAVAICICAWFLRGLRYKIILKRLDTDVTIPFSTACIFVSQTVNIIVPARLGDFVRMFILKHEKQTPYTAGFTSFAAERVYDIIIIAVLGLISLPFLIPLIPAEYSWFSYLIYGVLITGFAGVVFLILIRNAKTKNKILAKVLEIFAQFRTVSSSPFAFITLTLSSVIIWILDIIICYLVAIMFGCSVNFLLVLLAVVIGNLVKAVPITPGGIGTYELALAVILGLGGVPAASATLIAVIDHLIKNLVTIFGGIISLIVFGDWSVALMKRIFKEGKSGIKTDEEKTELK
ncbi:MAG TPA: lysylphosphatidylglycerol synthase transmembrane domain-containing protein [Methanocorpusculum sp.]|nr:lysylphosphatidylglycerol synthase transmembrane domain-containing protein [Methanocorpusculum sp.]